MSSPARRKELAAQHEARCRARETEERRKESLSMWERIDEANCDDSVKDILRRIAEHAGMELWG